MDSNFSVRNSDRILFWGHLGLGDHISMARAMESWSDRCKNVYVPCRRENLDNLNALFGYLQNVEFIPLDNSTNGAWATEEIFDLVKKTQADLLKVGIGTSRFLSKLFPELNMNSIYNISALLDPRDLISIRLRSHLSQKNLNQVPENDFIFVHADHSNNKLPNYLLETFHKRRILIVENSIEIPIFQLLSYVDYAQELHLVPSAPLCVALTVGARAPLKYVYGPRQISLKSSYPDWFWIDYPSSFSDIARTGIISSSNKLTDGIRQNLQKYRFF